MPEIRRIQSFKPKSQIIFGSLLVCANENDQLFLQNPLEGAISLQEFQSRASTLNKSQEIIFY